LVLLLNGRTGAGAGDVPRGALQQGLAWLTSLTKPDA
jgi:hypothetical protein